MEFPEPYIIPPRHEHRYTVVAVHGRGSSGEEFAEELFEGRTSADKRLLEDRSAHIKWIFPSAPERFSTAFQEELPEWFDIYSLTDPDAEHERQIDGLEQSVAYICGILQEEMKSVPADRIILGGISQGFATASHVLFSLPTPLGGFFGLSGWIPSKALSVSQPICSLQTPVYVSHSKDDTTVDSCHGEAALAKMKLFGYGGSLNLYDDGGHWIQEPQGHDDLDAFLRSCLR